MLLFPTPRRCDQGHEAERIEAALTGANANFVFAAYHEEGQSHSLKVDILAIPREGSGPCLPRRHALAIRRTDRGLNRPRTAGGNLV